MMSRGFVRSYNGRVADSLKVWPTLLRCLNVAEAVRFCRL